MAGTVRMAGAIQARRDVTHRTPTRSAKRGDRHSNRLEIREELAALGMRIR